MYKVNFIVIKTKMFMLSGTRKKRKNSDTKKDILRHLHLEWIF